MKLPCEIELAGGTPLFDDYVGGKSDLLSQLLGGFDRTDAGWGERARTGADVAAGEELIAHLVEVNETIGASAAVLEKLRHAAKGEARFVVTGQQPGAAGGPLLTLHKAVTAVALARWIEQVHDVRCVAMFWVGGDDVDFAEIRQVDFFDPQLATLGATIAADAHRVGQPVGDIAVDRSLQVWESVAPLLEPLQGSGWVSKQLADATALARDLGTFCGALLCRLLGGEIAIVDGRDPVVRRAAAGVMTSFFERETAIKELVEQRGRELERAGYHAQLTVGSDSGLFAIVDGLRKTIPDAQRASMRARVAAEPEAFTPGVILRSAVQDAVFRPVAVALGPAEIAYRAQIADVYTQLGVDRPIAFPRMLGTYAPPSLVSLLELHGRTDEAVADPAAYARTVFAEAGDATVEEAIAEFRASFAGLARTFRERVDAALSEKRAEKLGRRFQDIERRLEQTLDSARDAGKDRLLETWPFLASLEIVLRPGGRPQERRLSLLTPFLFGGEDAGNALVDVASAYVARAVDGDVPHIVYST